MKYASFIQRFVAMILDSFIFSGVTGILFSPFWCVFTFFPLLLSDHRGNLSFLSLMFFCFIALIGFVIQFAAMYFYYIYLPVKKLNGATLGKRALRIKIVKEDGSKLTQTDMIVREIVGKFVSGFAFDLGYIWALIDERSQTWHDKIAKTLVVEE